ncbi:hypothetical protein [Streptomyces reniochalinae]|uniref:Glycosyltransferase RgtA/B/C/D-like domain-containing protein n=1 Tax=Streptomyces reniochalinae TaxID=2250578 RepID=A0A367E6A6_9ACTN|nr:hypothetical protein [Streptomyces reniochalinae]RCG13588.1 hypothetical protein DQ392_31930 [Streptomyces reniochalinae]
MSDLLAVLAAVALVSAAVVVGSAIEREHGTLRVHWPPFYAELEPHVGPGTPFALLIAAAVVVYGRTVATRLPWRWLPPAAWGASMAWIWSLALVDGWHRGVENQLTSAYEYLQEIDRFDDVGAALRTFTDHILLHSSDNWVPHVAGHPPGAVLTFVGLDRLGLGGGPWASAFVITAGASAAAALLVALRALTDEEHARGAAPFLVAAPTAVWVGVSADGYFTAVAAWALALLALAATRAVRAPRAAALGSGLLFGLLCYLSYGLALCALLGLTVLALARTLRPVPHVLAGAAAVAAAFTLAGFNWWEGYHLLTERYYQGAAGIRPYSYWVWGNLACAATVAGPATLAGVRRALARGTTAAREATGHLRARRPGRPGDQNRSDVRERADARQGSDSRSRLVALVLAAALTVAVADLSGMSKAETERIWLPFLTWLLPAAALLPRAGARWWLAAQAAVALLVNHVLMTGW